MDTGSISEVETNLANFKCNLCIETFSDRSVFMKHRKTNHSEFTPKCNKLLIGGCKRDESQCWFAHSNKSTKNLKEVLFFQKVSQPQVPPDQLTSLISIIKNLSTKVENMEKNARRLES